MKAPKPTFVCVCHISAKHKKRRCPGAAEAVEVVAAEVAAEVEEVVEEVEEEVLTKALLNLSPVCDFFSFSIGVFCVEKPLGWKI